MTVATLDETFARLLESPDDGDDARALIDEVHEHSITLNLDAESIARAVLASTATKLSKVDDTPQDAPRVSGQDRRAEAELARKTYELLIDGL